MKIRINFLLFSILSIACFGQPKSKTIDTLNTKNYEYLFDKIETYYFDSIKTKAILYTKAYLEKARKQLDSIKMIESFYYLSDLNKNDYPLALTYIDSAIAYNKNRLYGSKSYLLYKYKGNLHYDNTSYKIALDNYVKAKEEIDFSEQQFPYLTVDYNIGLIMLEIGNIDEAIHIFRKSYNFLERNEKYKDSFSDSYLKSINGLSYSFLVRNELDSTIHYNQLEISESKIYNNKYHYNTSRIIEAFINYERGNYIKALDSIEKYHLYLEELKDNSCLAITTHLYRGKVYKKLNDTITAIRAFKKVDSIVDKNKKYISNIRENYDYLINYYRSRNDIENELLYIKKRSYFDSILYNNNIYLNKTIASKYETPKLLKKKNSLISRLQYDTIKKSQALYLLILVSFGLLVLTLYHYRKRSLYKKRFEALLKKDKIVKKEVVPEKQQLSIPNKVINDILQKIEEFENKKGFLDNSISLNSLSKTFKTNSNYLSRIINFHKGKNFNAYLSGLRIDYMIHILKEDKKLREYTLKAIAFEIGFNNIDTFTNAFYKQTKLYPSYFIKELQKRKLAV